MLVTKSNQITILPITNKNKLISLNSYFEKILLAKNEISIQLNQNETIQNLLFTFDNSKDKNKILFSYCNSLNYPIFSQWELQKFVNSDLLDREKNRIEQFFLNWKPKFKIYQSRENKNTKLSQLMILIAKNYFYSGYFDNKITEIFLSNKRYLDNERMIRSYVERSILNYKFKRKSITYTTSSMIKCEQRILGYSTPRIIKNNGNKLYQHWLCFDYIDENYEKQKINLPLAYDKEYHQDFKQYNKSLSSNKYKKSKSDKVDLRTLKFTIKNDEKKSLKKLNFKTLSFVNLSLSKHKSIKDNQDKIEVLFEREVQISLSKRTNRLTLTLSKEQEQNIESTPINENNTIGIDIGGSIHNTLVDSSGKIISFKHLDKLLDRLEIIDKLKDETKEEKLAKGKLLSLISRINEYYINLIIKDYLKDCEKNGIKHLVFEKLDRWSVKWKREKDSNQKYNRIFQLLRQDGLVELFKKQGRNKNILVHTIPSFYTSQMCSCCHKIEKNNLKTERRYVCSCGLNIDRDENASLNIRYILERFSSKLCKMNSYGEYESIKFINKEFTKKVLLSEKVKSFSVKSCI